MKAPYHGAFRGFVSISPTSNQDLCLTASLSDPTTTATFAQGFTMFYRPCNGSLPQNWMMSSTSGAIASGLAIGCLDVAANTIGAAIAGQSVGVWPCTGAFSQTWYPTAFGQLQNRNFPTRCLDIAPGTNLAVLSTCITSSVSQIFLSRGMLCVS
jgi:hypothetical protein